MASNNSTRSIGTLLDPNLFGAPKSVSQVLTGASVGGASSAVTEMTQLVQQLQQLQTVSQAQAESVQQNTQAVNQNTTQLGQSGPSTASKAASTIQSVLGFGLGVSPLITGLLGLFGGGGGSSETAAPTKFVLPPSVSLNAGVSEAAPAQAFGVDYAAGGQPRAAVSPAAPQITVQVQAIDSQSFLDHSNDIAMAVRQAMLESSVLNDVIRDV
jgi:hypothetical protein